MHLTPYADVNRMLELIQARVQEILAERLVGLYLSGSLVTGDFDLAVSDVDLVAVTSSDLTPAEIARLEAMHRAIARQEKTWAAQEMPEWASLIENALQSWREDWYNQRVDHGATLPETVRFVNDVVDRIAGRA